MTLIESAKAIIKQNGKCWGIDCMDCILNADNLCLEMDYEAQVEKAKEYIEEYEEE